MLMVNTTTRLTEIEKHDYLVLDPLVPLLPAALLGLFLALDGFRDKLQVN